MALKEARLPFRRIAAHVELDASVGQMKIPTPVVQILDGHVILAFAKIEVL